MARSSRADRYADAVKLDRAAMKVRNELRRGHPRASIVRAELNRARKALERLSG